VKLHFLFILFAASGIATANATALSSPNGPAPVISSANDTAGQSAAQSAPSAPPQAPQQAPQFPPTYKPASPVRHLGSPGSTYIPLDSWIYPAVLRLYSLGYIDSVFLGLRPWTRLNVEHMLERTADRVNDSDDEEARSIYLALFKELQPDAYPASGDTYGGVELETVYSRFLGISGTPLHDSFHVGETITNDYGRPYEEGFNNSSGLSARGVAWRFSL
jgi:hypothetical protein